MNDEHMQRLYLELTSLENRGITIWLEGAKSSSQDVASQLCVQEESTYMRDYIFDEGVLKEVHFDKIRKDLQSLVLTANACLSNYLTGHTVYAVNII